MSVDNLPVIVTWQWNGRKLNSWPLESQANALTITSPGHISLQAFVTILPVIVTWYMGMQAELMKIFTARAMLALQALY